MDILFAGFVIGLGTGIFGMLWVFSREPPLPKAPEYRAEPEQPFEPWNYR